MFINIAVARIDITTGYAGLGATSKLVCTDSTPYNIHIASYIKHHFLVSSKMFDKIIKELYLFRHTCR